MYALKSGTNAQPSLRRTVSHSVPRPRDGGCSEPFYTHTLSSVCLPEPHLRVITLITLMLFIDGIFGFRKVSN